MNRYRKPIFSRSSLTSVEPQEGEYIERKVERIVHNKEPITDGAPELYTDKKDGVVAGYNIRTDRWEVAAEAMDAIHRSQEAASKEKPKIGASEDEAKLASGDIAEGKSLEGSPKADSNKD